MSRQFAHYKRQATRQPRHWRMHLALLAHRIERRLGRHLTDAEADRISFLSDPLMLREMWLRFGGRLEARQGRLCLSQTLPGRSKP